MIRINVFIQTYDYVHRTEVLKAATKLTVLSLKEEGCVAYDIFESSTRKNVLMICETWKDIASLSAHEKTTHFTTLVGEMQKLATLKVEKFEF